jgi:hypothetical protein
MPKGEGVPNESLLAAALDLMKQNGKPLTKTNGTGRSMRYSMPSGETVRVRTCNDHILIVLGNKAEGDAKLNIQGTDWLLVVMPEVPRTPGKVLAYLVPTSEAAAAARKTHHAWLDTNPNTKGDNRTWNLWFSENGPAKANGFHTHWKKYLLKGSADAEPSPMAMKTDGSVKSEVETARLRISKAAGVPVTSVRISIDFGAAEVIPSVYQPLAAHGYGPDQLEEMKRFAQRTKPAR